MYNLTEILLEAARIVRQYYPGADFYEADMDLSQCSPGIPWIKSVFNVPADEKTRINTTAILMRLGQEFQLPPQHVGEPWLEDRVVTLPVKKDLDEAIQLARKAGFSAPVTHVTLRWALYPGVEEPNYYLAMPSLQLWVMVGANTGHVGSSPMPLEPGRAAEGIPAAMASKVQPPTGLRIQPS